MVAAAAFAGMGMAASWRRALARRINVMRRDRTPPNARAVAVAQNLHTRLPLVKAAKNGAKSRRASGARHGGRLWRKQRHRSAGLV
jgi:hypothetical protein